MKKTLQLLLLCFAFAAATPAFVRAGQSIIKLDGVMIVNTIVTTKEGIAVRGAIRTDGEFKNDKELEAYLLKNGFRFTTKDEAAAAKNKMGRPATLPPGKTFFFVVALGAEKDKVVAQK